MLFLIYWLSKSKLTFLTFCCLSSEIGHFWTFLYFSARITSSFCFLLRVSVFFFFIIWHQVTLFSCTSLGTLVQLCVRSSYVYTMLHQTGNLKGYTRVSSRQLLDQCWWYYALRCRFLTIKPIQVTYPRSQFHRMSLHWIILKLIPFWSFLTSVKYSYVVYKVLISIRSPHILGIALIGGLIRFKFAVSSRQLKGNV